MGVLASVPVDELKVNLRLGNESQDVKVLQALLNRETSTKVATTGVGSPGQETTYFGAKTRSALIRWQKKFGVTGERGWAGPKTRKALLSKNATFLADQWYKKYKNWVIPSRKKATTTTIVKQITPVVTSPIIDSISPLAGGNGASITLKGRNFSATSTVHTSYADLDNISSANGQTLQFSLDFPISAFADEETGQIELPGNLEIPIYIFITNNNGISNEVVYTLKI